MNIFDLLIKPNCASVLLPSRSQRGNNQESVTLQRPHTLNPELHLQQDDLQQPPVTKLEDPPVPQDPLLSHLRKYRMEPNVVFKSPE